MVPTVGRRFGFPMWSFSTIRSADIGILGGTFDRPETVLAPKTLGELGFVLARSRIVHLDTPPIAAHQVRDRVARGAPIDDLVPAAVADYIRTHELYQV